MRAKEKHKHTKNDKEKGTGITKYTGQRKIDEGHSIESIPWGCLRKNQNAPRPSELLFFAYSVLIATQISNINIQLAERANLGRVVVDSHIIQRIALATEETTVKKQVSYRPINCQSRLLW